jgi:hypothetical protein
MLRVPLRSSLSVRLGRLVGLPLRRSLNECPHKAFKVQLLGRRQLGSLGHFVGSVVRFVDLLLDRSTVGRLGSF